MALLITCFAGYYGTSFRNGRKMWFSAYCLYLSMRTQRGEAGNTPTLQDYPSVADTLGYPHLDIQVGLCTACDKEN